MQWDAIPFLGIVFVALMLLPLWMLISGIRHKGRIRMMVGGACFVVVFAFGVFLVDSFCSRHERILDHGTMPDGREYALIQLNNGEPYNLSMSDFLMTRPECSVETSCSKQLRFIRSHTKEVLGATHCLRNFL